MKNLAQNHYTFLIWPEWAWTVAITHTNIDAVITKHKYLINVIDKLLLRQFPDKKIGSKNTNTDAKKKKKYCHVEFTWPKYSIKITHQTIQF